LRIIYDTNILLQIVRKVDSMERLQARFNFQYLEEFISIATVAEIRSLAIQFSWGTNRIERMNEVLLDLPILEISSQEIVDKYVEIDCYSKRKHPYLTSNFSAIKMGKNDLWIAATASVHECTLLTMDLDFQHLQDKFIDIAYVEHSMFMN
jgi:tRNA(fMet)-specific endonuclease VapC